jgi:G3E family GTPase
LDAIHYLVIETSGVSDPARIIRTLDAKFGKMYRARLDSVVTVVDADQMMATLEESMSQAALAQLQCADVILLNKLDLLKDPHPDCQILEQRIRTINKNAVIHPTRNCRIPLSHILDVQHPETFRGGPISHEGSAVPIYVSTTGGALRCPSSQTQSQSQPSTTTTHIQADDFVSISVSLTDRPLSLTKLQQFVTSPRVQSLARMKGVVWVAFEWTRAVGIPIGWEVEGATSIGNGTHWQGILLPSP